MIRRRKVLAVLLPALLLVLAVGIAFSTRSAGPPVSGRSAPAPEPAAVTSGAKWLTGPAGRLLEVLNADAGRLRASARAGNRAVARAAAGRLIADARAARTGPMPPADRGVYRAALEAFERAGNYYFAGGKFSRAEILLNVAGSEITKITAAANRPAGMNSALGTFRRVY